MKHLERFALPMTVLLGGAVALRFTPRRQALPCPSWLSFLLENPYSDGLAEANTVIARAGIDPGMTVLDAGCRPGRMAADDSFVEHVPYRNWLPFILNFERPSLT